MRGGQGEFERIAMPHTGSLLRVARRLSSNSAAEDLVQDTLLHAWRSFDQWEPGTNIRAWLFRILVNNFYDKARRAGPVQSPIHEGMRQAGGVEEAAVVTQALERLSLEHRTVLLLAAVEGFTCREIAGIVGVPIGTVMSRLNRARQSMREQLNPETERVAR